MKHGVYEGKVIDACVGRNKSGQLRVELLLGNAEEETVSWFGNLHNPKSTAITIEQLKFLGLKDGQGPEVLIGKDAKFSVGEREYEGKMYEDVKLITFQGLRTRKEDRILGADAAAILFPKPYSPRERQPGEDFDDAPFG